MLWNLHCPKSGNKKNIQNKRKVDYKKILVTTEKRERVQRKNIAACVRYNTKKKSYVVWFVK